MGDHHTDPQRPAGGETAAPDDAPEVVEVTTREVSCDGGGGALGHPRVYYVIGPEGWVDCEYCDRRFVLKKSDRPDAAQ